MSTPMAEAYIAVNNLETLSLRVARRSQRGRPLAECAEQLRSSLSLLQHTPPSDAEIYRVATRRIVRLCARAWMQAAAAGTIGPEEHYAGREALVRVLASTPPPTPGTGA